MQQLVMVEGIQGWTGAEDLLWCAQALCSCCLCCCCCGGAVLSPAVPLHRGQIAALQHLLGYLSSSHPSLVIFTMLCPPRYQAPKLAAEEGAPGPAPPAAEEAQKQQQQQPPPPDIKPPSGAPPSIKQEQPQQQPQPPLQRATPPLPDAGVDGSMRQPAARGPPLPAAAAAAAAPGVPGRASQPGQQPGVGSGPSCSQGSVQPSGGSVLTASRAPKVRIKLPRSSAGGGGSGGGAAPGQQQGDGGDGPAAKRARQ